VFSLRQIRPYEERLFILKNNQNVHVQSNVRERQGQMATATQPERSFAFMMNVAVGERQTQMPAAQTDCAFAFMMKLRFSSAVGTR